MRLEIRTDRVDFTVSKAPAPKQDGEGRQKANRDTGELLYVTQLVAMDDDGADVIRVTTAGEPKVQVRQPVRVSGLVVKPWAMDGRSGIAFVADSIAAAKVSGGAT